MLLLFCLLGFFLFFFVTFETLVVARSLTAKHCSSGMLGWFYRQLGNMLSARLVPLRHTAAPGLFVCLANSWKSGRKICRTTHNAEIDCNEPEPNRLSHDWETNGNRYIYKEIILDEWIGCRGHTCGSTVMWMYYSVIDNNSTSYIRDILY